MRFEERHSFERNADAVMRMYVDRRFFERKYETTGARDIRVLEHESSAARFRIKCRYTVNNEADLPELAKKFIGAETVVTQEDEWDIAARSGRLVLDLKGTPAKVTAAMHLGDEGVGCVNRMVWTVDCGIPLIGGKLERVIADDIRRRSLADLAASRTILLDY